MSNKEFWEDDPDLFWAYRFSYIRKQEEKGKLLHYMAWLNGAYVNDAVSVALNNAFSKDKIDYPHRPYGEEDSEENVVDNEVIKLQNRVSQVQAIFKEKEKTERKED